MAKTYTYVEYVIHLGDKAQVAALQAAGAKFWFPLPGDPNFLLNTIPDDLKGLLYAPPTVAAAIYSAGIIPVNSAIPAAPYITSPWITSITQTNYPLDKLDFFSGPGAWFGDLFDSTIHYVWRGTYVYQPPADVSIIDGTPTAPEAIRERRWVDGFEHPNLGEGASGNLPVRFGSREGSRHVGGMGLAIRNISNTVKLHALNESRSGYTSTHSWERLYVRLRSLPNTATAFWRCHGATSGSAGIELQITPTGQIAINNMDSGGGRNLMATTPALTLNRWTRLDLVFEYGLAAYFKLFVKGSLAVNLSSFPTVGLGQAQNHATSEVGDSTGASTSQLGLDVDDWMNADVPVLFTGLDWTNGSRMKRVDATGFAASHNATAWPGSYLIALQMPATDADKFFVSTTSGARLALTTDAARSIDGQVNVIGVAAFVMSAYNARTAAMLDGKLGYSIAGGAAVLATIAESTVLSFGVQVLYHPSGAVTPVDITPLELYFEKGADAGSVSIGGLAAVVELLGVFGPEDVVDEAHVDSSTVPIGSGLHNTPYPETPWARLNGPAPISPVKVYGGTYVGTGTDLVLTFTAPINWFWCRRVTTLGTAQRWHSGMIAPTTGQGRAPAPEGMVQIQVDPAFVPPGGDVSQAQQYVVRIVGASVKSNNSGDTYQYIAVADPGMRFMLNGNVAYPTSTLDRVTALVNAHFQPEAGFFHKETMSDNSTVTGEWFKGRGHATAAASTLTAAETAASIIFGIGTFTTQSAFHDTLCETAFNLWRRDDGSDDPGVARVVQLQSYVGDGAASRTVAFSPQSLRYPLFALVVPHNGASVFRDPTHTGTTSATLGAGEAVTVNASTGITAGGLDQITVGSALNTNGVVYDVFVIPGGTVAGNNGFSTNGTFTPVEPAVPIDGPWEDPPEDPTPDQGEPVDPSQPEDPAEPTGDDFGPQCIAASQKVCNQALSHIGVSQPLVDVTTDATPEGQLCRLHYTDAVNESLREFPWPFLTRYATLAWVAGTEAAPVNGDWQRSYRTPDDMIFARRIVNDRLGRKFDANPPPFRVGSDATRWLLYTDWLKSTASDAAPAVELEYTYRPDCAATRGDALYRMALAWLVASKLAPALARNKVTAGECYQMFRDIGARAMKVAGNEQQQEQDGDASWIRERS